MSALNWTSTPVVQVAGWTLIHFIWQGSAVALAAAALLRLLARRSAAVRYLAACVSLVMMLAAPIATAAWLWPSSPADPPPPANHSPAAQMSAPVRAMPGPVFKSFVAPTDDDSRVPSAARAGRMLAVIVFAWLVGVAILFGRMAGGWWVVRRLHHASLATPASHWQPICARLASRLRLSRTIHVVESARVDVPAVIGWLRPVIVLPIAAIAALSPAQVEMILAHELAHIRRNDYAVNVLQTLAETLLFYHPATWWLSARIRTEREHCCDDAAVAVCGDAVSYARALIELERWRVESSPLALAATGGSLIDRVRRILRMPPTHEPRSSSWVVTLALTAVFTAGVAAVPHLPAIAIHAAPRPAVVVGPITFALASSDQSAEQLRPPPPPPTRQRPAPPPPPPPPPPAPMEHSGDIWNSQWSDNGDRLDARGSGSITFTDDLTDVKTLSDGGYLLLHEWKGSSTYEVQIRASSGTITRTFSSGGVARPWDAEARHWLAATLPRLVRRSGLGAKSRTRQILAAKGGDGVLDEIKLLEGDYVRRVYFRELFAATALDARTMTRALSLARTTIHSDYELAETLRAAAPVVASEASSKAYVEAANGLKSDYEHRRVLVALLHAGAAGTVGNDGTIDLVVQSAGTIRSDYERSETLRAALETGRVRHADAFFAAAGRMTSAYEQRRVLSQAIAQRPLDAGFQKDILVAAAGIGSAYDRASVLIEFVQAHGISEAAHEPFFAAVKTMDSDFEKRRVLTEVARKKPGGEILRSVFETVGTMHSDYDHAETLLVCADAAVNDAALRQAFVDAAQRIASAYERDRVLASLAKSERR